MGMLVGALGALSTFYPDGRDIVDSDTVELNICRVLGKLVTIAAFGYRHSRGLPYIYPDSSLGYCGNLLNMLFNYPGRTYTPDPILERALNILFILHADHEQNCSTSTMRAIGSSHADPYSALAGAAGALYGPLHGGANEAVLKMLTEIGSVANVPGYIKRVKNREVLLQGFGHRVYKNYDPRARIIKRTAYEVFDVTGKNPMIDLALELERIALEDDYFVSRKLYPNVDFYSGIIYQAMGLPVDMYPVLFAIPRASGWLAQWKELLGDEEQRIARPRQIYTGEDARPYVQMEDR
jgi:citrate synthase